MDPDRFDIFFFSLDEPYADEHWRLLSERFPRARRIHGIPIIAQAWSQAAELSGAEFFFSVDADNIIEQDFTFSWGQSFPPEENSVYVWRCRNEVNDLVYGNGAVKLWPKARVLEHKKSMALDFTAEVAGSHYVVIEKIASSCHFHKSPFHAWRSGFRETYKLLSQAFTGEGDQQALSRAITWMNKGLEKTNGVFCLLGATMAAQFFFDDQEQKARSLLHDFHFLKEKFEHVQDDPHTWLDKLRRTLPEPARDQAFLK